MPITLSKLQGNLATVEVAYLGETIAVTYRPALITDVLLADLQRLMVDVSTPGLSDAVDGLEDGTNANVSPEVLAAFTRLLTSVNELLCKLVVKWEAFEDDAATIMIPITPERLALLPLAFRMEVLGSLTGDARLGESTGTPSLPASAVSTARKAHATSKKRA